MNKRTLYGHAECKDKDGKRFGVTVYEERGQFVIQGGPNFYSHPCFPTVRTHSQIEAEIRLVFECEVTKFKSASEVNAELNAQLTSKPTAAPTPPPASA